jgi:nucleotide-binding universal stress UspA family protein
MTPSPERRLVVASGQKELDGAPTRKKSAMKQSEPGEPIVVGIDGSQAAIVAALWAADEAVSRNVPLRLVHVVDVEDDIDRDLDDDPAVIAKDWPETRYGRESLRAASTAVQFARKAVTLEVQIVWGEVDSMLIKESDRASMICLGSVGISPFCNELLGSTAAMVAAKAHCPVAIIRTPHCPPTSEPDWIVTSVDDGSDSDHIVGYAIDEARVRRAPVLALGVARRDHRGLQYDELERRVTAWRNDNPGVHIHPVAVPTDVAGFLGLHQELSVQLAVVGAADAEQVVAIVGPHREGHEPRNRCSVLVVR